MYLQLKSSTNDSSTVTRSLQTLSTSATETKQETHHIQIRANATSSKQSSKRPADTQNGCEQWKQQEPDVQSSETPTETSTKINQVRNKSKPENTNAQHNTFKRSRIEENDKVLGGVDTTSNCIKEKDLSSEGKDSLNNADEDRDYTNRTAQQSKKTNTLQESTVSFGMPVLGSYSRCAMT